MASSSLHQIRLFSLLFSKIYLNVHQKIKVDTSHPPTPDPHPGRTALVNAHLALWHMAAWAIWPSINLKSHSLVYSLFYMWVTRVFILSFATLIMVFILYSWAQRKSSHFPIQANTHASLLYLVYKVTLGPSFLSSYYFSIIWYKKQSFSFLSHPAGFLHPRTTFLFLWPLWFHFNKNSCYLHKINK